MTGRRRSREPRTTNARLYWSPAASGAAPSRCAGASYERSQSIAPTQHCTEVREVRVPLLVEHDVGGLDVAVDHTAAVCVVERAADLLHDASPVDQRHRAVRQRRLGASRPQPAHHKVGALAVAPVVIQRHNVWMFEPGDSLRVELEVAHERRVVGELGANHFERDLAAHCRLDGAVDDAARSLADPFDKAIAT